MMANHEIIAELDLGNLLIDKVEHLKHPITSNFNENKLKELASYGVQEFLSKIFSLPSEYHEHVPVAKLPEPTTIIPREKHVPKPKPPTKWEKFAKAKGIQKQKKDKLVWDEQSKDWKPTYGYRSAKNQSNDWLVEVPDNADPNTDFFGKKKEEKKERIAKNEYQRLRNIAATQKLKVTNLESVDKASKDQLSRSIAAAKTATASVGRFQEKLPKEKDPKKLMKKRKFKPNLETKTEKENNLKILEELNKKKPKLDVAEIGEEKNRPEKVTWDGHTASMEAATRAARANITIEEEIQQIHKIKGLPDEEKERIGPSNPQDSGPVSTAASSAPPIKRITIPAMSPVSAILPPRPVMPQPQGLIITPLPPPGPPPPHLLGLLDPRWVEQRDRAVQEKMTQEVYAQGTSIESSLKQFPERRTDIFGSGVEETAIGKKVLKEYDDDQIGPLDDEDITGFLSTSSKRVTHLLDDVEHIEEEELILGNCDEETKQKILNYAEDSGDEKIVEVVTEKRIEFDCESILSTYSNKFNHPTVIKEERVQKIQIPKNPLKKRLTKSKLKELENERDSNSESDDNVSVATTTFNTRVKGETPEQKRERKHLFKEAKRIGEEKKRPEKVTWDGHTASMEAATRAARAYITTEEQIQEIHKIKGLL